MRAVDLLLSAELLAGASCSSVRSWTGCCAPGWASRSPPAALWLTLAAVAAVARRAARGRVRRDGPPMSRRQSLTRAVRAARLASKRAAAVLAVLTYTLFRSWATGAASAVAGPRLAPVHAATPVSAR